MENPIAMDDKNGGSPILGHPHVSVRHINSQAKDLDPGLELRTTGMKQGQQHHSSVQTKIGQQERLSTRCEAQLGSEHQLRSPLLNYSVPNFGIHVGFQADRVRVYAGLERYVRQALGQGNYLVPVDDLGSLSFIVIHAHSWFMQSVT
jgi:hypothetical protein